MTTTPRPVRCGPSNQNNCSRTIRDYRTKRNMRKRFNTANEIRDAIDAAKKKFNHLLDLAESAEALGKTIEARNNRIKARQIKDNQLDILKNKLAEFCTDLLPGVCPDGDRSIPRSSKQSKRKRMEA